MARYMLTGIDPEQWKRFKAACNIQGKTIKQSFIEHINSVVRRYAVLIRHPTRSRDEPKKGGKRK